MKRLLLMQTIAYSFDFASGAQTLASFGILCSDKVSLCAESGVPSEDVLREV
jgi:hypothetical protein